MTTEFQRTGPIKELSSYPRWLQQVVHNTSREKLRVVNHELFASIRDAKLSPVRMRKFLVGAWPTIEQFPQFMAMNLKKIVHGRSRGETMARHYLIHNIRVEQKHAEHWIDWAKTVDLSPSGLSAGQGVEGLSALAHWCWYVCDRSSLAVAIAATNYAVEGVTGEWSCLICSKPTYAESLPEKLRGPATRWLRVHAEYDDLHPWEALDIVATLLGTDPAASEVQEVESAIRSTYVYYEMGLSHAMASSLHDSIIEPASNLATFKVLDTA